MELTNVIEKRASVRRFKDEPVDINDIKEMVRLASLAPSINNSQTIEYIAVTNREVLKMMGEAVHSKINSMFADTESHNNIVSKVEKFSTFFEEAPAVIAVINKPYTALVDNLLTDTSYSHDSINNLRNHPNVQSVGAAIQNLLLAAVDKEYGACWLTGPLLAKDSLEKILEIKTPFTLAAMVAIGKPTDDVNPKKKRDLDEILRIIE